MENAGKEIDITFKIRHTPEFTKGKLVQEEGVSSVSYLLRSCRALLPVSSG